MERGSGTLGKCAFQIEKQDNVATALEQLSPGAVQIRGAQDTTLAVTMEVPVGHKVALRDIVSGEDIVKYGVPIGRATQNIPRGSWVHLHCMQSIYDQRSSHLDVITGAPKDVEYE